MIFPELINPLTLLAPFTVCEIAERIFVLSGFVTLTKDNLYKSICQQM